jgi:phosphatidylinositol alpha-1,6-mannosyltransferase
LRIAICSTEFPPGPGGIGTHAFQLATHLKSQGWEVQVLSAQDFAAEEEISDFNRSQPFAMTRLHRVGNPLAFAACRLAVVGRVLRRWKPDLVVATGDGALYIAALAGLIRVAPMVAVEHGRVPHGAEMKLKRWALGRAGRVIAVSDYTRGNALAMGVAADKSCTIHNGADADFFTVLPQEEVQELRKRLGLEGKRVLLTVGNVTRRKGQDVVIRALPPILERQPGTHYVMAGLPTMRKEYEALAAELGVSGHVHFVGCISRRELLEWLNCCDLFVMTSRRTRDQFEGFGISVIEAALCGKTSVVSANSGLFEAIVDGQTGIAVPESDSKAVAKAVVNLLGDEGKRSGMGEAARLRALSMQTWRQAASQYDRVFRELIGLRSTQPCLSAGAASQAFER